MYCTAPPVCVVCYFLYCSSKKRKDSFSIINFLFALCVSLGSLAGKIPLWCTILICIFDSLMMMNCFCKMVEKRKAFSIISSWDHCQRFSPLFISKVLWVGFEPANNLNSGFFEGSCAEVIYMIFIYYIYILYMRRY